MEELPKQACRISSILHITRLQRFQYYYVGLSMKVSARDISPVLQQSLGEVLRSSPCDTFFHSGT